MLLHWTDNSYNCNLCWMMLMSVQPTICKVACVLYLYDEPSSWEIRVGFSTILAYTNYVFQVIPFVNYLVPNISCRYSPQVGIVSKMTCSQKCSDLLDHIWCKNDKHISDKMVIFWKFIYGCMFAAPLQELWWPILWQVHTERSTAFIADPDAEVLHDCDYCLVGRHDWTSICLFVCSFFWSVWL